MAMNVNINEMVARGYFVKVLAVNSTKNFTDIETISEDYRRATSYESIFFDLRVRPLQFIATYFTGKSPHIVRFVSKEFKQRLKELLSERNFDMVILESLFMCPYIDIIRQNSHARIVLRAHNIEYKIWQRICAATKNPLKKLLLIHVSNSLKRYELKSICKVDKIAAITDVDAAYFSANTRVPVVTVPFGFNLEKMIIPEGVSFEKDSLFHIGAMNWMPNVEGIKWFLDKVWPMVHKALPTVKFYLAGRSMPQEFYRDMPENVVVVGEVDDAKEFMCSKNIMVVPLLSGSGMRIKIIEGMAMHKAIVTTTVGAEGIDLENGRDVIIADDAIAMADGIVRLFKECNFATKIGAAAGETVKKYDITAACNQLLA